MRRIRRYCCLFALYAVAANADAWTLPATCSVEQLEQPQPQAEEVETWAWRLGKLLAQARAEPDNTLLLETRTDVAVRLLTLAAVAESRARTERAISLRDLVQRALAETVESLDRRAASGDPAAVAAQVESLWFGVLHLADQAQACSVLGSVPIAQLGLSARFRWAQCLRDSDPAASLRIMREVATDGHPAAAEALALLCRYGRDPDIDCLLQWGCTAVAGGRPRPAPLLAAALLESQTEGAASLAARLLRQGATADDPASMTALADLLASDRLGHSDPQAARQWYERAADRGWPDAIRKLKLIEQERSR
jgi:TPR repeat protein